VSKFFCAEKMSTLDTVKVGIVIVQGEKIGEASLIAGSEIGKGEMKYVLCYKFMF
jgi:hypothetical protein